MIPEHVSEWECDEKGLVVVKALKSQNKLFQKFISFLGYGLYKQIHLDAIGSFVWHQIDGRKTFLQIAEAMKAEFGSTIEPVYDRLGKYAHTLISQHFIQVNL